VVADYYCITAEYRDYKFWGLNQDWISQLCLMTGWISQFWKFGLK